MEVEGSLVGRTLAGRFRLEKCIGRGGMATVYSARVESGQGAGRDVALKVVNRELTRDPMVLKRFHREAKAASRLKHPNTVEVYEYGVDGDDAFIAMELAQGVDLLQALSAENPMRQARAALVVAQVCAGLGVAHAEGIIHRDLKPENVMLIGSPDDPAGERVKVLDFGIAKIVETAAVRGGDDEPPSYVTKTALTRVGTIVGTPAYMSPEQCRGGELDGRSDVYSCGVLLYQILTGEVPFTGETPLHTAMRHIHAQPKPPSELRRDLHPAFEKVVLKALAKWPGERHQTAEHLRAELLDLVQHLPDRGPHALAQVREMRGPADADGETPIEPTELGIATDARMEHGALGAGKLGSVRLSSGVGRTPKDPQRGARQQDAHADPAADDPKTAERASRPAPSAAALAATAPAGGSVRSTMQSAAPGRSPAPALRPPPPPAPAAGSAAVSATVQVQDAATSLSPSEQRSTQRGAWARSPGAPASNAPPTPHLGPAAGAQPAALAQSAGAAPPPARKITLRAGFPNERESTTEVSDAERAAGRAQTLGSAATRSGAPAASPHAHHPEEPRTLQKLQRPPGAPSNPPPVLTQPLQQQSQSNRAAPTLTARENGRASGPGSPASAAATTPRTAFGAAAAPAFGPTPHGPPDARRATETGLTPTAQIPTERVAEQEEAVLAKNHGPPSGPLESGGPESGDDDEPETFIRNPPPGPIQVGQGLSPHPAGYVDDAKFRGPESADEERKRTTHNTLVMEEAVRRGVVNHESVRPEHPSFGNDPRMVSSQGAPVHGQQPHSRAASVNPAGLGLVPRDAGVPSAALAQTLEASVGNEARAALDAAYDEGIARQRAAQLGGTNAHEPGRGPNEHMMRGARMIDDFNEISGSHPIPNHAASGDPSGFGQIKSTVRMSPDNVYAEIQRTRDPNALTGGHPYPVGTQRSPNAMRAIKAILDEMSATTVLLIGMGSGVLLVIVVLAVVLIAVHR